ncbi:Uncharacterized protein TCM_021826 [Theobroma cacao]|uniref:Uncharacterized protein n=1 Tax=Theobroma cacao TaxID=3641 RepID=A0A061EYM3_THECC|nr:Uncharacterized protein TCM_021826 [Theobroma cacao]
MSSLKRFKHQSRLYQLSLAVLFSPFTARDNLTFKICQKHFKSFALINPLINLVTLNKRKFPIQKEKTKKQ